MTRRPPRILSKRLVYIGCEGTSEVSYAGVLQDLLRSAFLPVHLEIHNLGCGAGDPLARIEMAARRLAWLRRTRSTPVDRFVFLDSDQAERDPQRAEQARILAGRHKIKIVWQRPCFEAMLLRHLPERASHRPPETPVALAALEREWPDYRKPMTRAALARRIDRAAILRAAEVEPDLHDLLLRLKLR